MTHIHNHRYVLAVKDLTRSLVYYNQVLGFQTYFEGGGWGFVKRNRCIIMLGECPESPEARELLNHNYFAYIEIGNVRKFYEELVAKGAHLLTDVVDKSWGMREFALETIDGHRIMFGEELIPE